MLQLLSTLVALMCSSDSPNSLCKIIVQVSEGVACLNPMPCACGRASQSTC